MAYAFVATVDAAAAASATTITRTITYASGENIVVAVEWDGLTGTVTVADGTHTFNQVGATDNDGGTRSIALFYARNTASGAFTITATYSAAQVNRKIAATRYTGLADAAGHDSKGQGQTNPATTADAVTSTLMTPTSQPALVYGISNNRVSTSTINSGTGFTDRGVLAAWDALLADASRVEDKRVTSTSTVAATFTSTNAVEVFLTIGGVFGEPATAANILPLSRSVMQAVNRAGVF